MCGGVMFMHEEKLIKAYFPNPKSTSPLKKKGNENKLIPWGRRKAGLLKSKSLKKYTSIRPIDPHEVISHLIFQPLQKVA